MSAARNTYVATVATLGPTQINSVFAAEAARQVSTLSPAAAAQVKAAAVYAAEQAKQAALMLARDTLRTAGSDNDAF